MLDLGEVEHVFAFGAGVVLGFVVGMVICYQILTSDVADHLPEYATLKAIGYTNRYLSSFSTRRWSSRRSGRAP